MRCQELRIAVCDDDTVFLEAMKSGIEKEIADFDIRYDLELYDNGRELTQKGDRLKDYDIFYLDIEMEEYDGLQIAAEIRKYNTGAHIFFITAEINYTRRMPFANPCTFYIKNSVNLDDTIYFSLHQIIDRRFIVVRSPHNTVKADKYKIKWIESDRHYLNYHFVGATGDDEILSERAKLDDVMLRLDDTGFVRTDRCIIVNINMVQLVSRKGIVLKDGTMLPVSASRYKEVYSRFALDEG